MRIEIDTLELKHVADLHRGYCIHEVIQVVARMTVLRKPLKMELVMRDQ